MKEHLLFIEKDEQNEEEQEQIPQKVLLFISDFLDESKTIYNTDYE